MSFTHIFITLPECQGIFFSLWCCSFLLPQVFHTFIYLDVAWEVWRCSQSLIVQKAKPECVDNNLKWAHSSLMEPCLWPAHIIHCYCTPINVIADSTGTAWKKCQLQPNAWWFNMKLRSVHISEENSTNQISVMFKLAIPHL